MYNNTQQPSSNLFQQYSQTIEMILQQVNVDPVGARIDIQNGYGWTFQFGSATIEIHIIEDNGAGFLRVLSPIIHLPMSGILPVYRRLLELNLRMTNASLGVYTDVVWVFSERPLNGLDVNEATYIIEQVARYADELDNDLVSEFGARMYSRV